MSFRGSSILDHRGRIMSGSGVPLPVAMGANVWLPCDTTNTTAGTTPDYFGGVAQLGTSFATPNKFPRLIGNASDKAHSLGYRGTDFMWRTPPTVTTTWTMCCSLYVSADVPVNAYYLTSPDGIAIAAAGSTGYVWGVSNGYADWGAVGIGSPRWVTIILRKTAANAYGAYVDGVNVANGVNTLPLDATGSLWAGVYSSSYLSTLVPVGTCKGDICYFPRAISNTELAALHAWLVARKAESAYQIRNRFRIYCPPVAGGTSIVNRGLRPYSVPGLFFASATPTYDAQGRVVWANDRASGVRFSGSLAGSLVACSFKQPSAPASLTTVVRNMVTTGTVASGFWSGYASDAGTYKHAVSSAGIGLDFGGVSAADLNWTTKGVHRDASRIAGYTAGLEFNVVPPSYNAGGIVAYWGHEDGGGYGPIVGAKASHFTITEAVTKAQSEAHMAWLETQMVTI